MQTNSLNLISGPSVRILIGEPVDILARVKKELAREFGDKFISPANPDFIERSYENFGVDDSRELTTSQSREALGKMGRYYLLTIKSATVPAQNAFLKTLEESGAGNHFVIITRTTDVFLPTILSRAEVTVVSADQVFSAETSQLATDFLTGNSAKRQKIVKQLLGEELDDRAKNEIKEFVRCLLVNYRVRLNLSTLSEDERYALAELDKIASSLDSGIASPKLFLPYLGMVIPQVIS